MTAVVLLGGLDPAGYAGLAADLHACAAAGVRAMPVACALTAQSRSGFSAAWPTDPDRVALMLAALASEPVAAAKTGMIGSVGNLRAIAAWLRDRPVPLIVDPVAASTSGGWLWPACDAEQVRRALVEELLPLAAAVTPNWPELAWLAGQPLADDLPAVRRQAALLPCAALVKGGHAPTPWLGSDFWWDGRELTPLPTKPPWPTSPRGTGCRLASAMAARMACGIAGIEAAISAAAWLDGWAREQVYGS